MIAKTIRSCFPIAAGAVKEKAEEINKLNVFPVPDGDTGTNMSLTLASVVKELDALPADSSMQDIAGAITHGSLMGARGNSGVITSQILRGIAEGLVNVEGIPTSADVAAAFRRSVKVAFQAVRKPIEGTILTVLRDLSEAADTCERERLSIEETLDALVVEAYQSVARTPDLLPVLKENGVVDSGAFGFAIFLENFVAAALGRTTEVEGFSATFDASDARSEAMGRVAIEANDDWEGSEFTYCTEFLFHAHSEIDEDATLAFLASMGDCELLVGSYPDYKIHVHSNTPDKVLGHMLEMGEIFEVFIHNMVLEAAERTQKIHEDEQQAPVQPAKPFGFVAVAAGEGQAEILKSLGVDVIVSGGQTMNPSTADLLEAVDKVNAEAVIILPNNGNIRMAADAAASACSTKKCAVIPTKSIPQAFSALFTVMPEMEFEDVVETMTDVLGDVRDGEVTCAVRDSSASDGSPIHAGDVMGIICGSIDVVGNDVCKVCLDCITKMQEEEEGDSLVILAGSDMDDDTFEGLCDQIEQLFPDLDIDAQRGEQPLYPVIFAIE